MAIERYFYSLWSIRSLDALAASAADYGLYACLLCVGIAWLRQHPRGAVLLFAAGAAIAAVAVWIAGSTYQEPRPFVVLGVTPLVPHGIDNAFPSDHSAVAAYAATFACFVDPLWGVFAWFAAIAMGIGRLYCLLHTPVDVVAGWMIGGLPAVAAGLLWRKTWITASSPPHSS